MVSIANRWKLRKTDSRAQAFQSKSNRMLDLRQSLLIIAGAKQRYSFGSAVSVSCEE
jgi:hypothetical protein